MTASADMARSWNRSARIGEIAQDNINEPRRDSPLIQWPPPAWERRHTYDARVGKENHQEKRERDQETPVEIFPCLKRISACRNRRERQVRRALRKRAPLFTQLALTLCVDRSGAEKRKNAKRSEENNRGIIARRAKVEGRPNRHAPEKRMPRDAQNSAHRFFLGRGT